MSDSFGFEYAGWKSGKYSKKKSNLRLLACLFLTKQISLAKMLGGFRINLAFVIAVRGQWTLGFAMLFCLGSVGHGLPEPALCLILGV